jgi:hypothetical protein
MEPEIIRAIPREAVLKRLFLGIGAGAVLTASKGFLYSRLTEYLSVPGREELLFRFRVLMAGMGLFLLPVIVLFSVQAYRIASSSQFPPPGTEVWRDTVIVRGRPALVRAVFVALGAVGLLCAAIYAQFIPQMTQR